MKDFQQLNVPEHKPDRTLKCKDLVADRNPYDNSSKRLNEWKVMKDLQQLNVPEHKPGRTLKCKDLVADRNPYDNSFKRLNDSPPQATCSISTT